MTRSTSASVLPSLEKPSIEGLTANNEVDLDKLGSAPLITFIRYTGMAAGDEVFPRWVGAGPAGEAFDDVSSSFFVQPGFDPVRGVMVEIGNDLVRGAADGWAFFSYSVQVGLTTTGSLRSFCYIGVRPSLGVETLAVLIAANSHDLTVNPSSLGTTMALLVAPYQAMQPGDEITVTLDGKNDRGQPYPWDKHLIVSTPGELQQTAVERTWLRRLDGGHFDAAYSIALREGGIVQSPVQRYRVNSRAVLPDFLAQPTVDNLRPGEPLDPARFRDGVTVRVPAYEGMTLSDQVVMHWLSNDDVHQVMRVDPSALASDGLRFNLPLRWLSSSEGRDVQIGYQFARAGRSLSSDKLTLTVLRSRPLPPPRVFDAIAEDIGGRLPAVIATGGVVVDVPADVQLDDDERIEMHWWGHPEQGRQVVSVPMMPGQPRRFRVDARYIAANMERNDNAVAKRFKVFYRLVRKHDPGSFVDSVPFMLRVLPLPSGNYPRIACPDADLTTLWLHKVPRGARMILAPWPFSAGEQWLSIWVQGVWRGEVDEVLWEGPISALQASAGVEVLLPRATLEQQVIGQGFTVFARVSFDGGHQYFALRSLSLTLR